jgi:formate hydrogenlyase subunit 3/multisubunit Na+/H+ antiporter MnhD subunit
LNNIFENPLSVIVFMPLISGFIMLFLPRGFGYFSKAFAFITSVFAFILSMRIYRYGSENFGWSLVQIGDFKLDLMLSVTPLGKFMLIFATVFALLITLYSFRSMAGSKRLNIFYGSVLLTIGGSAGIVLSEHLLFLLIFWEIVTASLYLLITAGGKESNFAATKSFAMIGASDAAFLLGIALVWISSGTFIVSNINLATTGAVPVAGFLLLLLAAITKAGALPLHTWIPTSGEYAPTSVMALLPAAIDKLLGIYLLVLITTRLFVIDSVVLRFIMLLVGAATVIIAVMIAMVQHNLKRLLSFHAISQVGYMVLGIATGTPVGIAGGVFHMLNNAIYKSCLFLCGGAVEQVTGTAELDRLGGLGKKMSVTFTCCLIAALSISGIPPFNGFVSKWMVYQGLIEMGSTQAGQAANLWPVWIACAMFGSALTLASFVKLLHSLFLSRLPDELQKKDIKEVGGSQKLPMIVLASVCVVFGIFYVYVLKYLIYPALSMKAEGVISSGTWQAETATIMLMTGIIVGLVIVVVGLVSRKVRIVKTWYCGEEADNDRMIIPGTHFYKTISSMKGLKQLYYAQEKGYFDLYNIAGRLGLLLTGFLRWLHSGVLPTYLTWVTLGLLVILFIVCRIW